MKLKQFLTKNKFSLILSLLLLTVVASITASYTLSKYTRTVDYNISVEITDDPPVLYRGFATYAASGYMDVWNSSSKPMEGYEDAAQNLGSNGMQGVTKVVMSSFNKYLGQSGFDGDKENDGLDKEDWKNREKKYWVQQESAANPEGTNLRGGIRLFYRDEEINGKTERVAYVLAKEDYPVTFPKASWQMFADSDAYSVTVTNIVFDYIDTRNVEDMSAMFWSCVHLENVEVNKLVTDKVTSMKQMFGYTVGLKNLDLTNFKTGNVTDMSQMFEGNWGLQTLNISSFDTSKVTDMNTMFYNCSGLSNLDVSHFDTSNVKYMHKMFEYCSSVTQLNVSNFNTSNVEDMYEMFTDCRSLASLNLKSFNTAKVKNMMAMFANCQALTILDVSSFDTSQVTDMERMFAYDQNIIKLTWDNNKFNTSAVTTMKQMFAGCHKLPEIDVSQFKTGRVENMSGMFRSCNSITTLSLTNFDTSKVIDMYRMFYGCSNLTTLDLSSFNTQLVHNMYRMFKDCSKLKTIYASNLWSTAGLTDGHEVEAVPEDGGVATEKITVNGNESIFMKCPSLVGGNGTVWDDIYGEHDHANNIYGSTDKEDFQYAYIDGGSGNRGYFTQK